MEGNYKKKWWESFKKLTHNPIFKWLKVPLTPHPPAHLKAEDEMNDFCSMMWFWAKKGLRQKSIIYIFSKGKQNKVAQNSKMSHIFVLFFYFYIVA